MGGRGGRGGSQRGAADVAGSFRAHAGDEADGVVGQLFVFAPLRDGGLGKGLVGVGRRGFKLRPAHDQPGVGLAHDMQQHVRVLLLRRLGAVALGVGVRRHMKRVQQRRLAHMAGDVFGEAPVDLVQDFGPVVQRPHFAHRLVADADDHPAQFARHRVHRAALVGPVLARARRLVGHAALLAAFRVAAGHHLASGRLVGHVVDARPRVHNRLERRMRRDIRDPLAANPNLPPVADGFAVLLAGANHFRARPFPPSGETLQNWRFA